MWCFVRDDSCHWYKIPVNKKSEFEDWVENNDTWEGESFDNFRCMSPENYMFPQVLVLKESKDFLESLIEEPLLAENPIEKPKLKKEKNTLKRRRRIP